MNRESVACVSPAMNAIGRVEMTLVVTSANGDITFENSASFYSSKFNSCVLYTHWTVYGKPVVNHLTVDTRGSIRTAIGLSSLCVEKSAQRSR